MTAQELAAQYLEYFEPLERLDRNDRVEFTTCKLRDDHPEELKDLIYEAHNDMGPDDHKYNFIQDALAMIAEADEDADLDDLDNEIEGDVYNSDLLKWLSSNLTRASYIEDYVKEFYSEITANKFDLYELIRYGQWLEKTEVFRSVLNSLREIIENLEEEDDTE